jgi:HK97 family phage major capsid protein
MNRAFFIGASLAAAPERKPMKYEASEVERRALEAFIRRGELSDASPQGSEKRDLSLGAAQVTQTQSVIVQGAFYAALLVALKAYDRLFDPDVTTFVTSKNGSSMLVPTIDDTANAAVATSEAGQDLDQDPTTSGILIPTASTYRTGLVKLSRELLEDSGIDPADFLARSFAVRLARGIGASIVTTILAHATAGPTAIGSSSNTGGSETGGTSVGTKDLVALMKAVDPAYRESGSARWVMNTNTLAALDSLLDNNGRPVLPAVYVDGVRVLFGFQVAVCPSMPNIGVNATPIAFGDTRYLVIRTVEGNVVLNRLEEKYADSGQVAFRAWMRASSALGVASAIKYLVNASS